MSSEGDDWLADRFGQATAQSNEFIESGVRSGICRKSTIVAPEIISDLFLNEGGWPPKRHNIGLALTKIFRCVVGRAVGQFQ